MKEGRISTAAVLEIFRSFLKACDLVAKQAEDYNLWFLSPNARERHLQTALRDLHQAIDGVTQEEGAMRALLGMAKGEKPT